jgi:hypothetical protein
MGSPLGIHQGGQAVTIIQEKIGPNFSHAIWYLEESLLKGKPTRKATLYNLLTLLITETAKLTMAKFLITAKAFRDLPVALISSASLTAKSGWEEEGPMLVM